MDDGERQMNWYYEQDGVSIGPVSESKLSELVNTGSITSESLVWNAGLEDWTQAILLVPALFVPKTRPGPEPVPAPASAETTDQAEEQEIKVKPVHGGAPSPSRLKRQAPSGDTPPPPLPEKKSPAKTPEKKKPGLLKRLFGGGE